MLENDITNSGTTCEKEIEIDLEKANEEKSNDDDTTQDLTTTTKTKPSFKTVEPKNVGELTDDERAIIIANAKNGIDQPNFDVRFFNNGKFRIVRKKTKPPTISEKVVKTQEIPATVKKAYYTDNQLLFEHIIELNAKVDRLMTKHKKLKRKYQTLQNDIYVDDDDIETVNIAEPKEEPNKQEPKNEPIKQVPPPRPNVQSIRQIPTSKPNRQNWRSQLRYL